MSALGHKPSWPHFRDMSAFYPKADILLRPIDVSFGLNVDMVEDAMKWVAIGLRSAHARILARHGETQLLIVFQPSQHATEEVIGSA